MTSWTRSLVVGVLAFKLTAAENPSPGFPAYQKANALFVAKDLPAAMAAVEDALRLDPRLVPALTLKAKLAMAGFRLDVARKCLEQALAIDPKSQYAQFLYGLEAYMGNNMKEALPRFRKAHQLAPNDPRAALYLGLTVESVGQPAEAMSLYQEAVRLERSAGGLHAETLLPGAKLLLLLNRVEECEQWLKEAARLAPDSRDVHFELARMLLKKGDPGPAAAEGESALRLSDGVTDDAAIHYLLIRAYRQTGMNDRAEAHAQIIRAQETPATRTPAR